MKKEETWVKEAKKAAAVVSRKKLGRREAEDLEGRQWTASCRLDAEEMEEFINLCRRRGTTRYAAIKAMIMEFIELGRSGTNHRRQR